MYDYIVAHGNDFAIMNYVFVALWILFLCTLPTLIYITLVRHPETNRRRYFRTLRFKDFPKESVEVSPIGSSGESPVDSNKNSAKESPATTRVQ